MLPCDDRRMQHQSQVFLQSHLVSTNQQLSNIFVGKVRTIVFEPYILKDYPDEHFGNTHFFKHPI